MPWRNALGGVLKVLQKERMVSLDKAQKVDSDLKKNINKLHGSISQSEQSEVVELQAALRFAYEKAAAVKEIEKDLIAMGEDIAVDEKVINQLRRLDQFLKSSLALAERDLKETMQDVSNAGKTTKEVLTNQIDRLRQLKTMLEMAAAQMEHGSSVARSKLPTTSREANRWAVRIAQVKADIEACKRELATLQAAINGRVTDKQWSNLRKSLMKYYKDLAKHLEQVSIPGIVLLDKNAHNAALDRFKKARNEELAAILMVLRANQQQYQTFLDAGVRVMQQNKANNLRRAGSYLARSI